MTLAEFHSLRGKMDATIRVDHTAGLSCRYGGLADRPVRWPGYPDHLAGSIRLNRGLGVAHVPELKSADSA